MISPINADLCFSLGKHKNSSISELLINKQKFLSDKFEDNVLFTFNDSASMFKHSKYDERKRTVLYLHGYREAPANESVRISISSYLPRKDHNVFAFDWSAVSGGNYLLTAIGNAITVSDA